MLIHDRQRWQRQRLAREQTLIRTDLVETSPTECNPQSTETLSLPQSKDVTDKDDSTIVATINPRMKDGYRIQLVARLVPESPNLLARKPK